MHKGLCHTLTRLVEPADVLLRFGAALARGAGEELRHLCKELLHALGADVADAEVELRFGVPLARGASEELRRLAKDCTTPSPLQ